MQTRTTADVLTELERIHHRFEWKLVAQSCPTSTTIYHRIRAVPKESPTTVLDPLGALCYIHYGKLLPPSDWPEAGRLLGLRAPGELVAAANNQIWAGLAGTREPVDFLLQLRRNLEKAVGLGSLGESSLTRDVPATHS